MTKEDLKALKISDGNGKNWFDSYQDVDSFLFEELNRLNLEYPTIKGNNKPHLNTIEAIKLLIRSSK